jgi:CHRD domain
VRKLVLLLVAGAVAALAIASISAARPAASITLEATLTAKSEVPKQAVKDARAHGQFTGTLTGTKLKWKLTYAGLTGKATAAHIHVGAAGKSGNVVVPLCGPCHSGMTGTATITTSLLKKIRAHGTYVNVHTAKNPAGEIRGQLAAM